ncbi:Membrane-fusion protein [Alloalcanivorax xenomutans]|uniref:efflux RND transporter periplasmic adaptor subunit n=1 Tax=Alloalcanivorax xenomutans TaxID=1094342 RepID=UPI0006D5CE92|nr:efflux RND transporter periplasmic adaptor subunit [Alloalcanivorax xenomutans]CUR46462.1 Membrane-fusion protein [Alloalcanivorax xenomutans]
MHQFPGKLSLWLASTLLLAACGNSEQSAPEPVSRPLKLFTVGKQPQERVLEFPGRVAAAQQSDMAFEVSGRITEIPVTEGERVKKGQVLARLDARDYQAERNRALAERNLAQADFNRYSRAFQAKAVSGQDVDHARRNLEVAEAHLKLANKAVEDTILRAPFAGRMARKLVEDFANVQAKQPVLILQNDDLLEMRVDVPEAIWIQSQRVDSARDIALDSDIHVVLSALPGQPIPARITEFSSTANPVTRTFEVTVTFHPPKGHSVSPGMTGHVTYQPSPETADNSLLIPAAAVVSAPNNSPYVWLFNESGGTVIHQNIEIGSWVDNGIQVLSGLKAGDRIAISGVHTLREDTPVHALEE